MEKKPTVAFLVKAFNGILHFCAIHRDGPISSIKHELIRINK